MSRSGQPFSISYQTPSQIASASALRTLNNQCPGSYSDGNPRGFGSVIGGAFAAIAEAKDNKNRTIQNAIATDNHWNLPNGEHRLPNGSTVYKGNNYLRYSHGDGLSHIKHRDGSFDTVSGPRSNL